MQLERKDCTAIMVYIYKDVAIALYILELAFVQSHLLREDIEFSAVHASHNSSFSDCQLPVTAEQEKASYNENFGEN